MRVECSVWVAAAVMLAGIPQWAASGEIHEAAKADDIITAAVLLRKSPELANAKERTGATPLHLAASYGHPSTADLLIRVGADVNAKMYMGYTPLHCAIMKDFPDVARLLIKSGADVDATTDQGYTSLHIAVRKNAYDAARLLVKAGADVNARAKDGSTPLSRATDAGASQMVGILRGRAPAGASADNAPDRARERAWNETIDESGMQEAAGETEPEGVAGHTTRDKTWDKMRNESGVWGTDQITADRMGRESRSRRESGSSSEYPSSFSLSAPEVRETSPQTDRSTRPSGDEEESTTGTIQFFDGSVYKGHLREGKMDGWGILTFPDGEKYEGQWVDGEKYGEGRAVFPDGDEYLGEWRHNKKEGFGSYVFGDNEKYVGQWRNDQMHGRGVYTYADGKMLNGNWQESRFVSRSLQ